MPSIIFPLEIEEKILDLLAEDDDGHSALKTCSLVCQAFLPLCRKHIFRSIALVSSHNTHLFERLLRETLKRISRLESLTFHQSKLPKVDWSDNPIRPALLHLLHLPTLTHFTMTNINNFLVSDLIPASTSITWKSVFIRVWQLKIFSLQIDLSIQSN